MSDATHKYKTRHIVFKILSIISTILPLVVYIIIGILNNTCGKINKIFLSFTVICAIILTIVNLLFKYKLRSPIFVLLLGIYVVLDNILT